MALKVVGPRTLGPPHCHPVGVRTPTGWPPLIVPATHGAGANKSDASTTMNPWVVGTDWYWETRTARFTCLITVTTVTKPGVCDRCRHKVDVMVDELSPLHQHVTELVVGCYT